MKDEEYYEIGQRIRRFRKVRGLSQEQLAEQVNISTTHMSHIETANTKLSLSVFIDIVNALNVRADDLLYDFPRPGAGDFADELQSVLNECDATRAKIVVDVSRAVRQALDTYL